MNMLKEDYLNILKLLDRVKLEGLAEAKYVAVLAHKLETKLSTWVDTAIDAIPLHKDEPK